MKLIYFNDWEKLVDEKGNTIIEGHTLYAKDLLNALNYEIETEYIEESEEE